MDDPTKNLLEKLLNLPDWFPDTRGDGGEVYRLPLPGKISSIEEAESIAAPLQKLLIDMGTDVIRKGPTYYLEILPDSVAIFEALRPQIKPSLFVVDRNWLTMGAYTDEGVPPSKGGRGEQQDGLVAKAVPAMKNAPELTKQILEALIADTSTHLTTGATVVAAAIYDGTATILNLGDSRASYFKYKTANGEVEAELLTEDHTPSPKFQIFNTEESFWVEWLGRVTIANGSDIGINHCIGDIDFGAAVSKKADIKAHNLGVSTKDERKFIMLGSDGAFGKTTLDSHALILSEGLKHVPQKSLSLIAEAMAKFAIVDGSKDNVTVGLAELTGNTMMLWLFDGHGGTKTVATAVAETDRILEKANKVGWNKAFAHREGQAVASLPAPQESELEKAYRSAWGLLPPERQALCFPNLKVAEECKTIYQRFAAGTKGLSRSVMGKVVAMAAGKQMTTVEELVKPVLRTFEKEGYVNRYNCTSILRGALEETFVLHDTLAIGIRADRAVTKFNKILNKLTVKAQHGGGLTNIEKNFHERETPYPGARR